MIALLLTIIAHVVADFLLQTDKMAADKQNRKWMGFLKHAVIIWLIMLLILHCYQPGAMLFYISIITVLHIVIDVLKSLFENKNKVSDFIVFIVDQLIHLLIIFITWQFIDLDTNQTVISFYKIIFTNKPVLAEILTVENGIRTLLTVIVYIYICWGGAFFIKKLLYLLSKGETKTGKKIIEEIYNIGYLIGILERLIIITLVINQALTAVGFIFAAKSIARYKELENKEFAEYYLVGTLASTALAIFGGLILNFFYQSLV